jgi:hypothetical protein
VFFETIAYSILLQLGARRESIYLVGIAPKYFAIAAIFAILIRMLFSYPVFESMATALIFFVTFYKVVHLSVRKSLIFATIGQGLYHVWMWTWLTLR